MLVTKKKKVQNERNGSVRTLKLVSALTLCIAIVFVLLQVFAEISVKVKINRNPKVDIVIAKGKTPIDLTNFEEDIKTELQRQGINTQNITFQRPVTEVAAISSSDLNISEIVNSWKTVGAETWACTSDGQIYSYVPGGQRNPAWWGTSLINPTEEAKETENFEMDFTLSAAGTLNEGPCFFVSDNEDGSLSGYFFNVSMHATGTYRCCLWRFDHYTIDQSFSGGINSIMWCSPYHGNGNIYYWSPGGVATYGNDSFTCLAAWTGYSNGQYHVEASNGNILIQMNGTTVADVLDDTYLKGTYGFWGNNCEQTDYMYLKDVKIKTKTTSYKTDEEVLRNINWAPNSSRLVISADSSEEKDSNYEMISRMLDQNVYYEGIGSSTNKSSIEELIRQNASNGIYVDDSDYENVVEKTAEYIRQILGNNNENSNYIILDDGSTLSSIPEDTQNDTADLDWPYGKWKVVHNDEYFENGNGQFENSESYIDVLPTELNKVGQYTFTYEDANVDPIDIYVHRRPVAKFSLSISNRTATVRSTSYDLDKQSQNNGISEEEWSYRKTTDSSWTTSSDLSTLDLDPNSTYFIRLRVKDYQNTWSEYSTKYLVTDDSVVPAPVAAFNIVNDNISYYHNLELTDDSYDPGGNEITTYKWTITKEQEDGSYLTVAENLEEPILDFNPSTNTSSYASQLGEGNYKITLIVENSKGKVSEPFTKSVTITNDVTAPEFVANPLTYETTNETIDVNLKFTDEESGFDYYKYAIQYGDETELEWSENIHKDIDTIKLVDQDQDLHLHIIAVDKAGNESKDRVLGTYRINQETFDLEIHLSDNNSNMSLGNSEFELLHPKLNSPDERIILRGTTDSEGVCHLNGHSMGRGTYEYIINQTKAPTGYTEVSIVSLKITFDEDGKITNVEKRYNQEAELESWDNEKIVLTLGSNKTQEAKKDTFNLVVEVEDEENSSTKLEGLNYKITSKAQSGEELSLSGATNENGIINIQNQFSGTGEIEIHIENEVVVDGEKTTNDRVVVINKVDDSITHMRWKSDESVVVTIDGKNVKCLLKEHKKETESKIQIQVVEAIDQSTTVGGLKVNIKDLKTGINKSLVTDSDGTVTFDAPEHTRDVSSNEERVKKGWYEFEVTVIDGPDEYNISSVNAKIIIVYDENGNIEGVSSSSGTIFAIFSRKEEVTTFVNYVIAKIEISYSINYKKYNFIIEKTDRDDEDTKLSGVEYEVTIEAGNSKKRAVKTTNSAGEISITLVAKETTVLTITEKKAKKGYILNSTPKVITLNVNDNGEFLGTDDVVIENSETGGTNTIIYKDTNLKKVSESNHEKKANITFNFKKEDEEGNAIGKVEFMVTELKTNQMFNGIITRENGTATLPEFPVYNEGKYVFEIEEVGNAKGFNAINSKITVEITYAIVNDEMKAIRHVITTGNKYVKNKEFEQYEDYYNYQLNCNLTIKNIRDMSDSKILYLDIKNQDRYDNSNVVGGQYSVTVTSLDVNTVLNTVTYKPFEVVDGIELPLYISGDRIRIEIYNVNAPLGYERDDNSAVIYLDNNLKLESYNYTTNITRINNSNYTVSDVMEVIIPKERKMLPFAVKIENTIDDVPDYFITDIAYNLRYKEIDHLATSMTGEESPTAVKGEAVIPNLKGGGKLEMTLQQLSVPYGFKLDSKVYNLTFYRNPDDLSISYIENESDFPAENIRIDNLTQEIFLDIKNDLDFTINIEKVDSLDPTKKLQNAKFEVTSNNNNQPGQTIVTDENGLAAAIFNHVTPDATVIYTIKETEAPTGYRLAREFKLQVEFDKTGKIRKYEILKNGDEECDWAEIYSPQQYVHVGTSYVLNPDVYLENSQITLRVKDSDRYSFIINKVDKSPEANGEDPMPITGAEFDIVITHNNTVETYHKATIDGIIKLKDLEGTGEISIRYQETAAGFGYINNNASGTIVLNIDPTTNEMTIDRDKTTEDLSNVTIDNNLGEVRTVVENESEFKIGLKVVDTLSGMTLDGARFEIKTDEGDTDTKETADGGEAIFKVGKVHKSKTVTYTIMQLVAPTGYPQVYNPIDDIVIKLHFNQYGGVSYTIAQEADRVSNIEIPNGISSISSNFNENEINIEITNGEQDEYTLKLVKENENNSDIKIKGTQFSIVGKNPNGSEQFNNPLETTNSSGVITIEHVDIQDGFSVVMQEIKNSDGYVFDDTVRTVNFNATFSDTGAKIITATTQDPRTIVQVDNVNNVIEMRVTNEPRNVGVTIKKADKEDNNIYLSDARFQIKDMDSGKTYTLITGDNGIGYTDILIKPDGTYQYKLIEEQAPLGYKKAKEMTVEIDFENDEVKAVRQLQQAEIFSIDEVKPRYIEFTVQDEQKSGILEEYTLEVRRVNQANTSEGVPNAKTKVEITNSEYATLTKVENTNQGGSIYINKALKGPGETVIKITEMDRVEGYEWDSSDKLVYLDRNSETEEYRVVSAQGISTSRVTIDNTNKMITIMVGNNKKDVFVSTNAVVRTPFTVQIVSIVKGTNVAAVGNYSAKISASKNSPRTSYNYGNKRTERQQLPGWYWDRWAGRAGYYYREFGTVTMSQIYGNEDINIKVSQDSISSGYAPLEEEQLIEVHRDEATGQFTLIKEGEKTQTTFDQDENKIIIRIEVTPTFTINLEKQDSANPTEKLEGVEFDVVSSSGNSAHVTTGTGGAARALVGESIPNGTIIYTIRETKKLDGYRELGSDIKLKVTFDERGLIKNHQIIEGGDFSEIYFPEQISYSMGGYHSLDVNKEIYLGTGAIKLLVNNNNTFKFIIQNEDKEINGTRIADSEFKITLTDSQGVSKDYIGEPQGKTDVNGMLYVNNLKGSEILTLHYEQVKAGDGYRTDTNIKGDIKIYKDPVDYKIKLLSYTGSIDDLEIDEDNGVIKLIIRNERKLELEIEKVDINDPKTSKLSNVEFKLTSQVIERNNITVVEDAKEEGTLKTDTNGIARIDLGKAEPQTKVAYVLEETVVPTGYNKIGNIRINVTYNEKGQIKEIQNITSSRASTYKDGLGTIKLRIANGNINVNSNGENVLGYDFKIQKTDKMIQNYPVDGAVYNVKIYQNDTLIKDEDIETMTSYIGDTVVAKGIAEINNLIEDGTIRIEAIEKETVEGYAIDNTLYTIQLNVTYGQASDYVLSKDLVPTITIDEDNTTVPISNVNINNLERIVTLNVEEEPQVILGIKQQLVDENLVMPTGNYRVTALETNKELYLGVYDPRTDAAEIEDLLNRYTTATSLNEIATSDSSGEAYVNLGRPIVDKTVVYLIDRLNADNEYENLSKIAILYDSYGKIKRYYEIKYNLYVEIDPEDDYEGMSHINVNIYMDEISQAEPYDLEIYKVDLNNKNITIPGAKLKLELTNEQGETSTISKIATTDEDGKILIKDISGTGNIDINIEELVAPEGRKLDESDKYITIYRKPTTGEMQMIEGENIDYDISDRNKIILYVQNEQADNLYSLCLRKVDDSGVAIREEGILFNVEIEGKEQTYSTNGNGEILLTNLTLPERAGTYTFKITEIKGPEGYEVNENTIELEVDIEQDEGARIIDGVRIVNGTNATIDKVAKNYISIDIENKEEKEEEEEIYLRSTEYLIGTGVNDASEWSPGKLSEYEEGDLYIKGIRPQAGIRVYKNQDPTNEGTYLEEFLGNLETNADEIKVYIPEKDESGNVVLKKEFTDEEGLVATGMILKLRKGEKELQITLIVRGDLLKYDELVGDGKITNLEAAKLIKLNRRTLTTEFTVEEQQAIDYYVDTSKQWSTNKQAIRGAYLKHTLDAIR